MMAAPKVLRIEQRFLVLVSAIRLESFEEPRGNFSSGGIL